MKIYSVQAKRWEHGWELYIDGLGVTQSRGLDDADAMVRDYIALDLDVPPDSFGVEITPETSEDPLTPRERQIVEQYAEMLRRSQDPPAREA